MTKFFFDCDLPSLRRARLLPTPGENQNLVILSSSNPEME
jgi:hypothetical protein